MRSNKGPPRTAHRLPNLRGFARLYPVADPHARPVRGRRTETIAGERQRMNSQNKRISIAAAAAFAFLIGSPGSPLFAATNFVALQGAHILPYDTWEKAATDIQSAIDVAADGDVVLVTDGCYEVSAQIAIASGIEIRSVNGAPATTVRRAGPETHRLFHLGHANARLNGFALSNGIATGSGSDGYGGAVLMAGGAAIENCIVSDNEAGAQGGGISFGYDNGGLVQDCVITRNRSGGDGGGLFGYRCTVRNSDIFDNYARADGGGVHLGGGGLIEKCRVANNVAGRAGGGILARGDVVRNCLIVANVASNRGGGIGHFIDGPGQFYNCTIVSNRAPMGGGVEGGTLGNTILCYNSADNGSNYYTGTFSHCCSAPPPDGTGNISADPMFRAPSNFRLGPSSPCIDAGIDGYDTPGAHDLDGAPRIVHGAVDMGAYEYRESFLSCSNSGDMVLCMWNVLPDEAYRFERSTNLESADWIPIYEMYGGNSSSVEFLDNNASGIGFYRAVYLAPP